MDFRNTVSLQLIYNKIYKIILLYYIFLIINKELFLYVTNIEIKSQRISNPIYILNLVFFHSNVAKLSGKIRCKCGIIKNAC